MEKGRERGWRGEGLRRVRAMSWDGSCGDHVEVMTPQLFCSRLLLRAVVV